MTHHTSRHHDPAMATCIDECTSCHATCLETINHCLQMGGKHADPSHISLLAACADICATSAATMLRGAAVSPVICAACATVCQQCADSCTRIGSDDDQMQRCAEACRRCAESCAAMSAMPSH
jgi:hypothetical protein